MFLDFFGKQLVFEILEHLLILPYFVYTSNEGSGETSKIDRLVRVLAACMLAVH